MGSMFDNNLKYACYLLVCSPKYKWFKAQPD